MVDTTTENKKLIEEMLRDAKGTTRQNERVIHSGSGDLPAPMIMQVKDSGIVTIYEVKTGEELHVLRNMLGQLLGATDPDGSLRFTTVKPNITPKRGTLKCRLHAESPDREHYNELGLPVCRKANITAPYMVIQHMRKRHPTAWAIIEAEKKEAEKLEERDFQRSIIRGIQKKTK